MKLETVTDRKLATIVTYLLPEYRVFVEAAQDPLSDEQGLQPHADHVKQQLVQLLQTSYYVW